MGIHQGMIDIGKKEDLVGKSVVAHFQYENAKFCADFKFLSTDQTS